MTLVTCERCGRRYRLKLLEGMEQKECICGHKIAIPRGVRQRIVDTLLFGFGFSVAAAVIPFLGLFNWRWRHGFNRQHFLAIALSYVPARVLVGFALGAAVGWFSKGLALSAFDFITEKPRR
jgi:hypothetical protein